MIKIWRHATECESVVLLDFRIVESQMEGRSKSNGKITFLRNVRHFLLD